MELHARRQERAPLGRAALTALLVAAVVASTAPAASRDAASRDAANAADEEAVFYLLSVRHQDTILAENVPALALPTGAFVSFPAFLDALELPVKRNGSTWSGWAFTEKNAFHWNMDAETKDWVESEDGVMVSLERLEEWFSLGLELDPRRQLLDVTTTQPLPYQQRGERRARRQRGAGKGPGEPPVEVVDRYRWITAPLFDVTLDALWNEGPAGGTSSQSVSVDMGLDLLKHSVIYDGTITRSDERGTDAQHRLTFARGAPTRTSSLPLGITRYSFGDVFSTSRNLVGGGGAGLGFIVERRRDGQVDTLNQATIVGNAQPGWDVELYRNGQLVDFGQVGVDGRYVFEDQEALYGENVFVAKLYGPQGQARSERHLIWGGGVDLARGDHEFTVQHVDFRQRLIDDDRGPDELVSASHLTEARFSRAFTDSIQAGLAFSDAGVLSRDSGKGFVDSRYASAFVRASIARGVLLGEAVHQLDGGSALSAQYLTTLFGHRLDVTHQVFDDFESPATRRREPSSSLSQLTVSGPLGWGGFEHYTLRASTRVRLDSGSEMRLFGRIGGRWGGVFLTNDLEWTSPSHGDDRLRGRLRASARLGRVNLTAVLDYEPTDAEILKQAQAIARWRMGPAWHATASLRHQFSSDDALLLDAQLTARVRGVDLSLRAATDLDDDWSVGVSLLFHLGRRGHDRTFFDSDRSVARSGHAELAPFIDRNGNGVRDAGEEGVEWFSYKGEEPHAKSPGLVVLPAVPERTAMPIETRHMRFDDPFLVPRDGAYEIYTHAGSRLRVDVPLLLTGDISGSVVPLLLTGARSGDIEVRGVVVTLLDRHGKVVTVTETEFDGYFSFEAVPVGPYEVLVEHPSRDGVVASRSFEIHPDAGQVVVSDFYLGEEQLLAHLPGGDRPRVASTALGDTPARHDERLSWVPLVPARPPTGSDDPSRNLLR